MGRRSELSSKKIKCVTIETESNLTSNEESDIGSEGFVPHSEDTESLEESASEDDGMKSKNLMQNEGWADSVAKILGTNKPRNKKTLVLSRAKKYSEVLKKEEPSSFDVVREEKFKIEATKLGAEIGSKDVLKKKLDQPTPRVKPSILEKDRERVLAKIATKGVVQLFNAVKNQQNTFSREINAHGVSESKKEQILKKFDKRTFLNTLMGQTKSVVVEENTGVKDEAKEESKPKWNVLRDDFMMGAKMKDWDKSSDEE